MATQLLSRRLSWRNRELVELWLQGYSVEGICHELRKKRGAVLRFLQRAVHLDPAFPRRDPETDRAVTGE